MPDEPQLPIYENDDFICEIYNKKDKDGGEVITISVTEKDKDYLLILKENIQSLFETEGEIESRYASYLEDIKNKKTESNK